MIHPISVLLFLLNIIILFSIIIFQMTVIVSCRHWGNHLHLYSSIHLFQVKCKGFCLLLLHFLSSWVSAAPHISIISAACILCCIKCFHHGYYVCIKLFTTGVICVSGAVTWISCFVLLLNLFLCIIFITLCCYPLYIALEHDIVS